MRPFLNVIVAALAALITGCAGFGIVATPDPLDKLNDAEDLFARQARPLPAEQLIREAMTIYEERNDAHGLGHANREYGDLLRSPSMYKWETVYRRDGFRDRSITFDNRDEKAREFYQKALIYYERAAEQHKRAGKYDSLTNVYLNMAWSNNQLAQREKACSFFDQSVEAYNENLRSNPGARPILPAGTSSYAEYIESRKRYAGC
jgi:tetratricopeptide (TPR) repeat protein